MITEPNPMDADRTLPPWRGEHTIPHDPRGNLATNDFLMVTSIDNGQVFNAADGSLVAPRFGNDNA